MGVSHLHNNQVMSDLRLSLESIDYKQKPELFEQLATAVGELRKQPKSNRNALEVVGITKIIFEHTGINLDSEYLPNYFNASILPPFIDARSPLLTYIMEGLKVGNDDRPGLDHSLMFDEGTIDLENGKVDGVFSKVKGTLHVGFPLLAHLTDREVAAIILHECGHQFAYFEYITHASTLAVNLNWCASRLAKTNEKTARVRLIINTAKNLKVNVDDPDKLADPADPQAAITVLMESYTRRVRSGTGADFYDFRSWEALADQFATRQGAGRDLATGLDKLMRTFGVYGGIGVTLLSYLGDIAVVGGLIGSLITSPVVGFLVLGLVGLSLVSPFPPEGTYDNPKQRLVRVKNEMIGALKDPNVPADFAKRIHEDVAKLDELIDNVGRFDSLISGLWRVMTSYRRGNYRQIELQAELEKLANNDLFLAASKLNTLAV